MPGGSTGDLEGGERKEGIDEKLEGIKRVVVMRNGSGARRNTNPERVIF